MAHHHPVHKKDAVVTDVFRASYAWHYVNPQASCLLLSGMCVCEGGKCAFGNIYSSPWWDQGWGGGSPRARDCGVFLRAELQIGPG